MNLLTKINSTIALDNETTLSMGQDGNTFTVFYSVEHDADVDGSSITYDLFIKHKSSDFMTKLKDNDDVVFVATQLAAISASTTSTGYVTVNVDSGYTLLDNVSYVVVFASDNTAGLSTLDVWTQVSSV